MGDVVVITGASGGVGRATARRFAKDGAKIALVARGRGGLEAAACEVEKHGGRALVLPTDVADAGAVEAAAEAAERELGPIDVWVNNALVSVYAPIADMAAAEFRRVTEVTYLGYVHGTLAALHRMRPRDRGVIVQVGSALAYRSIPLQSAYCAAKHAIVGFTASLRSELIHDRSHVRVAMVHMPALNTPQFDWTRNRLPNRPQPVPPIFQPEVGAEAVFHASQHDVGRELMVAWPTVKATLGNKVIPGLLDHYLADVAWEGEQTNEPEDPDRPDNLFEPVPGDWAAHGRFDHRSKPESWELTLRFNRNLLAVAGAGVLGLALGALTGRKQETGSRKLGAGNGKVAADRADAYDDALDYARADGAAVEPPRAALEPPDPALAALHVPAA
jgi:NAD(P)-dependent dehydrogenase (short-subunit alcohol dehydrogenase family)